MDDALVDGEHRLQIQHAAYPGRRRRHPAAQPEILQGLKYRHDVGMSLIFFQLLRNLPGTHPLIPHSRGFQGKDSLRDAELFAVDDKHFAFIFFCRHAGVLPCSGDTRRHADADNLISGIRRGAE